MRKIGIIREKGKRIQDAFKTHSKRIQIESPNEKTALQRQIDAMDKQIDRLVYELYGLTEEEVRIVEGDRV